MPVSSKLKLGSGVGLVVANMIGAGVFLSAGFMAQELTPGQVLLAWVVGAVLALCGAATYAGVVQLVPRSGGEYRFLSELLHPALGYLAGWTSMLLGFSGPIAIDAFAAASFMKRLAPDLPLTLTAALIVIALTLVHAFDFRTSKWTQNVLVLVKAALVLGFVAFGLLLGSHEYPTWLPPDRAPEFPLSAFAGSLFFIAFAFSGYNAAVYVAEDFEKPKRDVPRAMLIGCAIVSVVYLIVNWVLVANITPESARVVFTYEAERVTLAHVVAGAISGPRAATLVGIGMIVALISAASAMTFIGPRVYAAMADDGFLPKALKARQGRPPLGSVLLQGAIALAILMSHRLQELLTDVGAVLTFFAALTGIALIRARLTRTSGPKPSGVTVAAAVVFVASACWMLYFGLQRSKYLGLWLAVFIILAGAGYLAATASKNRSARAAARSTS